MSSNVGQEPNTVCVLPVFEGHANLFPKACKATKLHQPNEVKICCPSDVLLTPDASAVWETGKSGIHARVDTLQTGTLYVGDRGNVLGGGILLNQPNYRCGQ